MQALGPLLGAIPWGNPSAVNKHCRSTLLPRVQMKKVSDTHHTKQQVHRPVQRSGDCSAGVPSRFKLEQCMHCRSKHIPTAQQMRNHCFTKKKHWNTTRLQTNTTWQHNKATSNTFFKSYATKIHTRNKHYYTGSTIPDDP